MRSKKTIQEKYTAAKKDAVNHICEFYDIHIPKHYSRSLYDEFMGNKKPINESLSSELGYAWEHCEDEYLA